MGLNGLDRLAAIRDRIDAVALFLERGERDHLVHLAVLGQQQVGLAGPLQGNHLRLGPQDVDCGLNGGWLDPPSRQLGDLREQSGLARRLGQMRVHAGAQNSLRLIAVDQRCGQDEIHLGGLRRTTNYLAQLDA